ncbi:MAG TPA: hypothetical protein VF718_01385 [Allosphingosinicella sp.]|jgi:hypothetical protein
MGIRLLLRLALAALVAGAAAGLLLASAILLGATVLGGGWTSQAPTLPGLVAGLGAGLGGGLIVASGPAFLAGAAMCALARRFEGARRASAWAAAGAAAGLGLWAVVATAVERRIGEPGLVRPDGALVAAGLGLAAALAFRAIARPGRSEAL